MPQLEHIEAIEKRLWEAADTLRASSQNGAKSATELMASLKLSHRPTFRNNYIRPALSAGLVEMTRPESPTAKNQRYRLTARGRAAAR